MKRVYFFTFFLLCFFCNSVKLNAAIITNSVASVSSQLAIPMNIEKTDSSATKIDVVKNVISKLGIFYNRKKISNLIGDSRKVLLTFDDGPNPRVTPKILEILRKRNLKAIFFVLGLQVKKYPDIVKQIHSEGHIIGNHSYNHKDLTKLTRDQIEAQIDTTNDLIEAITGEKVTFLRPPYGALNPTVTNIIVTKGMSIMLWDVDPQDWKNKNQFETLHNLQKQLHIGSKRERGGIVLMHDIYGSTARALDPFLDKLVENNFSITSINQISSVTENKWASTAPFLFKQKFNIPFKLNNTSNNLLVSKLKTKKNKKEISALSLLKAKRAGNLITFMFNKKL